MEGINDKPELYHPDILARAKDPARWRKVHDAQYIIKAYNPVCGDKFEIRFDMDGRISDTSFFGYGCIVSKASTALLCDMLIGLNIPDARSLMENYLESLVNELRSEIDARLQPYQIARKFPGRIQCATLSWEAVLRSPVFAGK